MQVKLTELVLDYDMYPRNDVSSQTVTSLCDSLSMRDPLPPIVADEKSKRVVDGFHRYKAHERLKLPTIEVTWRKYKNDADLFADAYRLNAQHGRPFDSFDRRRAIMRFQDFGLSVVQISNIVRMPKARIDEYVTEFVKGASGQTVVLKHGLIAELKGRRLTKGQEAANESWSGQQPTFHVNQLIRLLEANIVPDSTAFEEGMDKLTALWATAKKKKP